MNHVNKMLTTCKEFIERKISAKDFKKMFNTSFVDYANSEQQIDPILKLISSNANKFNEKLQHISTDNISEFDLRLSVIDSMKKLDKEGKLKDVISADFRFVHLK